MLIEIVGINKNPSHFYDVDSVSRKTRTLRDGFLNRYGKRLGMFWIAVMFATIAIGLEVLYLPKLSSWGFGLDIAAMTVEAVGVVALRYLAGKALNAYREIYEVELKILQHPKDKIHLTDIKRHLAQTSFSLRDRDHAVNYLISSV